MQLHREPSRGSGGRQRGVLNGDALAAFVGLIQFRLQHGREVALKVGQIGAQVEPECLVILACFAGRGGNIAGNGDRDRLARDIQRGGNRRNFDSEIRAERQRRYGDQDRIRRQTPETDVVR